MRLTTVILIAALMQVSAAGLAQKVSLSQTNGQLKTVLRDIRKQSGYNFVYTDVLLKKAKPINIKVKDIDLEVVLNKIFSDQPLTYEVNNKTVVIKERSEPSFIKNLMARFRAIDVKGKVLNENGGPLVGSTVAVKGTNRSVKTDQNGAFFLSSIDEKAVLVISYIGYESREIEVVSDMGSLTLNVADAKLEEVEINTGYYTVKEKERTGSISRITSKDIEKQPVNNVLAAMQANLTGVQITQTTGVPGGSFTVQIRGKNSLQQGGDPYYIIDGVPFSSVSLSPGVVGITPNANPLASINPNDIESVEVLKDADATAIYGSRGANGVILITTKRGKVGKAQTNISITQGISRVGKMMDLMNTEQYISMRKEALKNDNLQVASTDYDLNAWDQNRYTNWQKELIGGIAPTTTIQASLSGGTENITYLVGGNYYKEGTVFIGNQSYTRGSGNFSLQYLSDNKKFNAIIDANYSDVNSNLFQVDLTQYITLAPNYPALLNKEGLLNWENNTLYTNPIAETRKPFNARTNNLIGNALLSYTIIPDLKLKTSFGYNILNRNEYSGTPLSSYAPVNKYGPERRISNFANNSTSNWIFEAQANYVKKLRYGTLNALLGTTFQQGLIKFQNVRGSGFNSDALINDLRSASTLSISQNTYLQYRYTAAFGRLNYTLDDKYILNLTGRRDGSTRFGTDKQFANFGAIGAAWVISEENYIKENLPFISFAKLRGSYGITGNDQIPDYGYLELWRPTLNYQGISTVSPSTLANPNFAWEVNKKAELALDLGFINDRIRLSADYYSNKSSNQLVSKQLPPSTGFTGIQDNLPAKIENTGWEFELNTKNIATKVITWNTSFNITIPRNKLIEYPGLATSADASKYVIGQPLTIKKLYNTSVDPQTGLYISEDYDKNGEIDFDKDLYVIAFNGRKFYGGLQNSFTYHNIGLDFLFQFVKQSGIGELTNFPETPGKFTFSNPTSNQPAFLINNWKNQGDNAKYQKFSTDFPAFLGSIYASNYGSFALSDASYIRLKNISLSYNFPNRLLKKAKISSAKFFLQGQNIFTITHYKGLDPETQSGSRLPPLQVYTAGIQLTL
ncbi:SusC/RagA family TonB-linked outer membrane protein [Pedobacter hartonius]|uniref:TonB-linked outer membrane protein, SusC/RagA family n=1 Tax=Pedobacter hartonius TaxID=425514 RepID=A0A1H4CTY9_9SPHI|nr:SusC/RagA family TonB-linked outer membrane protein [Pedobacter hartonius]SEA63870.1 TonB-linked outer membrane protein, SusC/RagA family [Pedobacter hartonius]